tara:strand:- start:346 stop:465 length:120 start_codon:yes stop_codon:yes gene_type:complete
MKFLGYTIILIASFYGYLNLSKEQVRVQMELYRLGLEEE